MHYSYKFPIGCGVDDPSELNSWIKVTHNLSGELMYILTYIYMYVHIYVCGKLIERNWIIVDDHRSYNALIFFFVISNRY